MHIDLVFNQVYLYIAVTCGLGFLYGVFNLLNVLSIDTTKKFDLSDEKRISVKSQDATKDGGLLINETSQKIQNVSLLILYRVLLHFL
jgi:hypothetical protein